MKKILLRWLLYFIFMSQVPGKSQNDFSSVVLLKFDVQQENKTTFFIKLALNETKCPINNCDVSLADVFEAGELAKLPSVVLANATRSLGLTELEFYNAFIRCKMTINSTLYYLDIFETSFFEIYNNFVNNLTNPGETVPKILNILQVNVPDFMAAAAYGTDLMRLQILSTGNYSFDNYIALLKVTQKNLTDLIGYLPLNRVFKNIGKVNESKLLVFVHDLAITSRQLENFYLALKVHTNNFFKYDAFVKVDKDLDTFLNQQETLGVFISRVKVVTSSVANALTFFRNNTDFIQNYTKFYLESLGNSSNRYYVENVTLESGEYVHEVAIIYSKTPFLGVPSQLGLIYDATKMYNCTLVSKSSNRFVTENFDNVLIHNTTFTVIKSNKTIYSLGSPMYCHNKMYGLAIENHPKYINFTKFKTYKIIIPSVVSSTPAPEPNSSQTARFNFTLMTMAIFIVLYFNFI
ncbi:hypothetical protein FQA39_LY18524 [Lamprigera yunnana]|nr:hypothetical protein FQA39_LY18524 [Lamprigera yunnana]